MRLHDVFYATAKKFGDNKCITYDTGHDVQTFTYSHIKSLADICGEALKSISKKCAFIGVFAYDATPEIVAILIGILNIGSAFAYIDGNSDNAIFLDKLNCRLCILEDSLACVFHKDLRDTICGDFYLNEIKFKIWARWDCEETAATLNAFAYGIRSSGSTGVAKTIKVTHDCILPNILDFKKIYQLHSRDVIFLTSPLTFDPSISDLFTAFACSASVLMIPAPLKLEESSLKRALISHEVTYLFSTPSLFLARRLHLMEKCCLKIVALGGETFPPLRAVKSWTIGAKFFNLYGTTEVSSWASCALMNEDAEDGSLGQPLSHTSFEVRGENGERIAGDGIGELWIGSETRICVLENESEKIPNGEIFRATGDMVQVRLKNGTRAYFFKGRKERLRKFLSVTVDLNCVEKVISDRLDGAACRAIVISDKIVVFALRKDSPFESIYGEESSLDDGAKLNGVLPVIPRDIVSLSAFPVNNHGKICDETLKKRYLEEMAGKVRKDMSRGDFSRIWRRFAKGDDGAGFMDAGGNSMSALEFHASLKERWPVSGEFLPCLLSNRSMEICYRAVRGVNGAAEDGELTKSLGSFRRKIKRKSGKATLIMYKGKMTNLTQRASAYCDSSFNETNFNSRLKTNWKVDLGKCVDASPALLLYNDGRRVVICGSHSGVLACVNVPTGEIIYKIALPDRIESGICLSSCGRYFYVGCYTGEVYCLRVENGEIRWSFKSEDIVKCTPVFRESRLYFGSYDRRIYCLNAYNGKLAWKFRIDDSGVFATPLIFENGILVATLGGNVAFLSKKARALWRQKVGPVFSSPLSLGGGVAKCLIADVNGCLRCFHVKDGRELWTFQLDGNVFADIALDVFKNYIYVACRNNVYCLDTCEERPKIRWKCEHTVKVSSTPFIGYNNGEQPFVITACSDSTISIGNGEGAAELAAKISDNSECFSSPVFIGGNILVGCRDNYLYCVSFSSEK